MITDNWVESNYSLQDHIAIKPRVYRLRGCVGEVVNRQSNKYAQYALQQLQKAKIVANVISTAQKFTGFTSWVIPFIPVVSVATQVAMTALATINQTTDFFKQQYPQNSNVANEYLGRRQAYVYAALRYALENRVEVALDGLQFDDTERLKFKKGVQYQRRYFLQSVSARQGDSKYISDIEVTVKEFRIAQTKFTTPKDTQAYPAAAQKTEEANKGNAKGESVIQTQEERDAMDKLTKSLFKTPSPPNAIQKIANKISNAVNKVTGWDKVLEQRGIK